MEEVGEAMGGGAGLVFPGGRIAPAHRFCFLHVVVLHLDPTNCDGFNGFLIVRSNLKKTVMLTK